MAIKVWGKASKPLCGSMPRFWAALLAWVVCIPPASASIIDDAALVLLFGVKEGGSTPVIDGARWQKIMNYPMVYVAGDENAGTISVAAREMRESGDQCLYEATIELISPANRFIAIRRYDLRKAVRLRIDPVRLDNKTPQAAAFQIESQQGFCTHVDGYRIEPYCNSDSELHSPLHVGIVEEALVRDAFEVLRKDWACGPK